MEAHKYDQNEGRGIMGVFWLMEQSLFCHSLMLNGTVNYILGINH